MDHLKGLNEAQRRAVRHTDGPLLILAGAGSGKTRTIVHRIAELIRSGVAPEKILAVTFTNKAAGEMKERVGALLGSDFSLSPYDTPRTAPFIGTFHALSIHIIKTFHKKAGLPARFKIYDREDSRKALRQAITDVGFDPKELEPRRVLSVMGKHKGNAVSLEEFRSEHLSSYIDEAIAEVWEKYAEALSKDKALDFDDILVVAHGLLAKHDDARDFFQRAWEYLHVDEYQDTNRIQYEIVRMLSERHRNVCVVGDIDQNVYSWRGASIEHMLHFEHDFPGAVVVPLVENYRSTKNIIAAANDAIAKNVKRKEKELHTKNEDGEKIIIAGFQSEAEEAAFAAREAARLIQKGESPDDIAVLYRANFQSRVLEEAFLSRDIPYQVVGTRFFERKEIKDLLSYMRLALDPESVSDFVRAIQNPPRGVGKVTIAKVMQREEDSLPASARGKLEAFRATIMRIREAILHKKASESLRIAMTESGLWRLYEKSAEDTERLENLKELVTVASKYDTLPPEEGIERLLEESALQSDQDELSTPKQGVKLMTVHAAKGLEFGTVFVVGLEDGLFPHERDGADDVDEEEERRLFYVALTRAKKRAYLTYAGTRHIFGTRVINMPSEFITEMDPALVDIVSNAEETHDIPSITY